MLEMYRDHRLRLAARLREQSDMLGVENAQIENMRLREEAYHHTLGADIALNQFRLPPSNSAYMYTMALVNKEISRTPQIGREDLLACSRDYYDDGLVLLRERDGRVQGEEILYSRENVTLREDLTFRKRFQGMIPGVKYRCILAGADGDLILGYNLAQDVLSVSQEGKLNWHLTSYDFSSVLNSSDFFSSFTQKNGVIIACSALASQVVEIGCRGQLLHVHDLSEMGVTFVDYDPVGDVFICVNELNAQIVITDRHFNVTKTWGDPDGKWRPVQVRRVGDMYLACWGRGHWQSKVQWFSENGEPGDIIFQQTQAPVHSCKSAVFPSGEAVIFDHFGTITGIDEVGEPLWRFGLAGKSYRIYYGGVSGDSFIFSDMGVLRKFRMPGVA